MYPLRVSRQLATGPSPGPASRAGDSEQPRAAPPGSRPFTPLLPAVRDFSPQEQFQSPYFPHHLATPQAQYPLPPPSTSTFAAVPAPNITQTLGQIQLSLTALHERLSTLERTQALFLRREERRRSWKLFNWASGGDGDDLDELEDQAYRARWAESNTNTASATRRKPKASLTLRVTWHLITAIRRAMFDLGVGMLISIFVVVALSGGWRRGRHTLSLILSRARRFIASAAQ